MVQKLNGSYRFTASWNIKYATYIMDRGYIRVFEKEILSQSAAAHHRGNTSCTRSKGDKQRPAM
jgi:hypothetical protein